MKNKICITIVDTHFGEELIEKMKQIGESYFLVMHGKGTAKRNLFDFLGKAENEKTILLANLSPDRQVAYEKFIKENSNNKGIFFKIEKGEKNMYKLVLAIVQYGNAQSIVDIARESGAKGGTIIPARGTGANLHNFIGMPIDSEKEMVMVVAENNIAETIVNNISERLNKNGELNGIVFALPVSDTIMPYNK